MYAISGNTMYVWRTIYTPYHEMLFIVRHQAIQEVRHTKKYRIHTISGNVTYVWITIYTPHLAIQYIVRHIKKYKKYATPGDTVCCAPHQEIQEVCNKRKYRMCVKAENALYVWRTIYMPHQDIKCVVLHSRKNRKHVTSGNTWCTP